MLMQRSLPRRWSELSYAGEDRVPPSVDSTAFSWPLVFLKRDEQGNFADPNGCTLTLAIRHPETFDFENQQLEIVRETLMNLTPEQVCIAEYWNAGPATKQWTPIIDRLIDTYVMTPVRAARVLAAVHGAINDALNITWYLKYVYDVPRPNQLDQHLRTIVCTPYWPSYPSGHSVVAGCAEAVLSYFFQPESERLRQLAEECAVSRLYGGVHFPADNSEGLRLGRQIGSVISGMLAGQSDSTGAMIDIPINENGMADLPPPPYRQVIPFPRERVCGSLLDPRECPSAR